MIGKNKKVKIQNFVRNSWIASKETLSSIIVFVIILFVFYGIIRLFHHHVIM